MSGDNRTAFNVNLGRRMNQYDLWDGLPSLAGHDAIYVQPENAELPQALRATFQRCDEGKPVIIETLGFELETILSLSMLGILRRATAPPPGPILTC